MKTPKWGEGVYNLISWFDISKVEKATVLVVGAGALGNEVLKNLALLGVGNIIIVDFDKIEYSNLTRSVLFRKKDAELQAYKSEIAAQRIREINPGINVTWLNGDIEKEIGLGYFRAADVVIGCLDSMIARYTLNSYAFRFNTPWIDGGIKNLDGNAAMYEVGNTCYACSLSDEAKQSINIRLGCADVFKENMSFGRVATTPISASIIGAIQVQEALKVIHNYKSGDELGEFQRVKTLLNRSFYYEGMNLDMYSTGAKYYYNDCPHHESWNNIIEDTNLTTKFTIADLFLYFKNQYGEEIEYVHLRNPFVTHLLIRPENRKYELMVPDSKVGEFVRKNKIRVGVDETAYKLPSPEGGYDYISSDFKWKNLTLEKIGIPKFDIIHIETNKKDYFIELTSEK